MGLDALPESIKRSTVLSANDLARLAQFPVVPDITVLGINFTRDYNHLPTDGLHQQIKKFIAADQLLEAWALVRSGEEHA